MDQLWGLHSLLFNGCQDSFAVGYSSRGAKVTPNLYIVLRVRISSAILYCAYMVSWHGQGKVLLLLINI